MKLTGNELLLLCESVCCSLCRFCWSTQSSTSLH